MKTTTIALAGAFLLQTASHAVEIVIDNGDPGYTTSGVTEQLQAAPPFDTYGADQAFNTTGGDLSANATYAFDGLTDGTYEVFASWRLNGQGNADIMQVAVSDDGPTVSVDQRNIGPNPDLVINDGTTDINFQKIGSVVSGDGEVVVTISLGVGGAQMFFINDAIALSGPIGDADGDGMPDDWEDMFAGLDKDDPTDRDEDILDADGLTNFEEFQEGTDPTNADSDGDTLEDGDEVDNLGTDPTKADTDGDSLNDNVETKTGIFRTATDTGTDPLLRDTDGDLIPDGVEVTEGSDPNDINSVPGSDFDGLIAYVIPIGTPGNQAYGLGLGMDFNVGEDPISITHFGAFDDGSDGISDGVTLTVSLWERDPADETLSLGQVDSSVEFTSTTPGKLIGGSRFIELATPIELAAGFQGTITAHGFTSGTDRNGNGEGFGTLEDGGGLISFVGLSRYGLGGVGTFPEVVDGGPANRYGSATFVYEAGSTAPFVITAIVYDSSINTATLTWNSKPGEQYIIEFADDFTPEGPGALIWNEITDDWDSQGDSTTYEATGIPASTKRRFFRIRR